MCPIEIGPTDRLKQVLVPTLGVLNPVRLDLGTTYQALRFILAGTLTVAGAAATILEDSPLGLIRSMDLLIGGPPLRSMPARSIFHLNTIQQATQPRITAPSGAIGSSTFSAEWTIDLWQPDLLFGLPKAFWLDADFLSSVLLNIQVGTDVDIATPGGGGTDTISNLTLRIEVVEALDYGGQLSQMQIIRQVVKSITAVGTVDLDPFTGGGVVYRGFLLHATSGNADPIRASSDDTIITDVSVLVPSRRIMDATGWQSLRAETKRVYTLTGVDLHAGIALVDFAKEHHLGHVLDTAGEQNVSMRLTIAAAPANAIVTVYPLVFRRRELRGKPGVLPLPQRKVRVG